VQVHHYDIWTGLLGQGDGRRLTCGFRRRSRVCSSAFLRNSVGAVAFPALQARHGFLPAGAAMGLVVALWHLPLFFTPGQPQSTFGFVPFLLTLIIVRILFGWVYNGTAGSILLCVLLHASGNAWSEILPVQPPHFTQAWAVETAVFAVAVAIALLIQRRQVLSSRKLSSGESSGSR
jgi:hypothetical protein